MSALQILHFQGDSFRINTENFISVLNQVGSRPLAIYSINGATRTGKSYALNYFIQYLESGCPDDDSWCPGNAPIPNKFLYKSGKERTTVGIHLWSKPYFVTQNGREIAILLMDTQGLFDEQTNSRQNAIIYSLSALCSSVSIFNLMKNLDENVLQQIDFFSSYAHLVSAEEDDDKNHSDSEPFQKLAFLIRDFDFPEYEYGLHDMNKTEPESPRNFCRDIFAPTGSKCLPENRFVREKIRESYGQVSTFLLPYPGVKFVRSDQDPIPDDYFREKMVFFTSKILHPSQLVTKRIGGQEMTGEGLQVYIKAWARLCDKADQHFPPVQTILETSATIQNTLAMNTADSHYDKKFQAHLQSHPAGIPDGQFVSLHEKIKGEALVMFDGVPKLGDKEKIDQFRNLLLESISKAFEANRKFNQLLVAKAATEKQVEEHKKDIQHLQEEMTKAENQNQAKQQELQAKIQQSENKMKQVESDNQKVQSQLKTQIEESQKKVNDMSKMADQFREELKQEKENTIKLIEKQARQMAETQQQNSMLLREINTARVQMTELEKKNTEFQTQLRTQSETMGKMMQEHQQNVAKMNADHTAQLQNIQQQIKPRKKKFFEKALEISLPPVLGSVLSGFGGASKERK